MQINAVCKFKINAKFNGFCSVKNLMISDFLITSRDFHEVTEVII